jgi:hypothetical protein
MATTVARVEFGYKLHGWHNQRPNIEDIAALFNTGCATATCPTFELPVWRVLDEDCKFLLQQPIRFRDIKKLITSFNRLLTLHAPLW